MVQSHQGAGGIGGLNRIRVVKGYRSLQASRAYIDVYSRNLERNWTNCCLGTHELALFYIEPPTITLSATTAQHRRELHWTNGNHKLHSVVLHSSACYYFVRYAQHSIQENFTGSMMNISLTALFYISPHTIILSRKAQHSTKRNLTEYFQLIHD